MPPRSPAWVAETQLAKGLPRSPRVCASKKLELEWSQSLIPSTLAQDADAPSENAGSCAWSLPRRACKPSSPHSRVSLQPVKAVATVPHSQPMG